MLPARVFFVGQFGNSGEHGAGHLHQGGASLVLGRLEISSTAETSATILVMLFFRLNSALPTDSRQRHMQGPRSPHYDYCLFVQLYIT